MSALFPTTAAVVRVAHQVETVVPTKCLSGITFRFALARLAFFTMFTLVPTVATVIAIGF